MSDRRKFVVALTGGSGSVYGRRLVQVLIESGAVVHLTVSDAAAKVFRHEMDVPLDIDSEESVRRALLGSGPVDRVQYHHYLDLEQPVASGSYRHDGMVVVPCSGGTLGSIASGASTNLIHRAAEVCLKERRRLILVTRETPISIITIENMLRVTRAGAVVLPASSGFYGRPHSVEQLVDFVVSRVLDHLDVENKLLNRYGEPARRRHPENEPGDYDPHFV